MTAHGRSLVLVDFENLWIGWAKHTPTPPMPSAAPSHDYDETWLRDQPGVTATAEADEDGTVVVIASNLHSADDPRLSLAYLRAFGRRLAHFGVGATRAHVEVVLTLPVPQAVDAVLERMLGESPSTRADGRFDRIALLSDDRGLASRIGARVVPADGRAEDRRSWRTWGTTPAWLREHHPKAAAVAEVVRVDDDVRSVRVRAKHVAWAREQPLDVPVHLELSGLCAALSVNAGLLTQIGPTEPSLAGVHRLAALPSTQPVLVGPCTGDDGLELRCDAPAPGRHRASFSRSTLGAGAIRLEGPPSTAHTRLPTVVLAQLDQLEIGARGDVDDADALARLSRQATRLARQVAKVRLELRGKNTLRVSVARDHGKTPSLWWAEPPRSAADHARATSDRDVVIGSRALLPADLDDIDACAAVLASGPALVLQAPRPTAEVHVDKAILASTIGLGTSGRVRYAVLAPKKGLQPGRHRCQTIQSVPDGHEHRFPDIDPNCFAALRALPLVVPVEGP